MRDAWDSIWECNKCNSTLQLWGIPGILDSLIKLCPNCDDIEKHKKRMTFCCLVKTKED